MSIRRRPKSTAGTEAVLEGIDWRKLNKRVVAEQHNRERYSPAISLFRWWARRPASLMGALLDASLDGGLTSVSDPFSGGGTVALEAAARGMPTYAQDLHPWPTVGLATALDGADPHAIKEAADSLLQGLGTAVRDLYRTPCPRHGADSEIVHAFWVQSATCPNCANDVYLFPYSLVSLASRGADEDHGYFGCTACGTVTRSSLDVEERRCRSCHCRLAPQDQPLTPGRIASCRWCRYGFRLFDGLAKYDRGICLVLRTCDADDKTNFHFDYPMPNDMFDEAEDVPIPKALAAKIPNGIETNLLRRAGFRRWADLYPTRQLSVLVEALNVARNLATEPAIKRRILLAICGCAEMAGFVSRWDRYYPKAFEAVANHRFSCVGFSCEVNPLSLRGRGTLPRRLKASVAAAEWAQEEILPARRPIRSSSRSRRRSLGAATVIVTGSSERQILADRSIDLVLTDPPYLDDVQYGELSSLFDSWGRASGLIAHDVKVDLKREIVPNRVRQTTVDDYAEMLTAVFRECQRTLVAHGRLLLTFHNNDLRAWNGLSAALKQAGFHVRALAVAEAENTSDHSKRGRNVFTKDLVIECAAGIQGEDVKVVTRMVDDQDRELIAAGRAIAEVGDAGLDEFRRVLAEKLEPKKTNRIQEGIRLGGEAARKRNRKVANSVPAGSR